MIWRLIQGGLSGPGAPTLLIELAAIIVVMLLCLPFHEFAHAWMAKRMGDNTAQMHGRLTLDPIKHLDIWGLVMFLAVGFGFAKPVPVNPRNFKNRKKGMLLTSLAGPASNLILSFPLALFAGVAFHVNWRFPSETMELVAVFFAMVLMYNIFLMVFNMLPIPPLDGFSVLDFFLPPRASLFINQYARVIQMVFFGLMILGTFSWIISFFARPIYRGFLNAAIALVGVFF